MTLHPFVQQPLSSEQAHQMFALFTQWTLDYSDNTRLLVIADFCEESQANADAFMYRWMAKHNKRPLWRDRHPHPIQGIVGRKVSKDVAWGWWCQIYDEDESRPEVLPRYMWGAISAVKKYRTMIGSGHIYYSCVDLALEDLRSGLAHIQKEMTL